jgi:hypothetical protein
MLLQDQEVVQGQVEVVAILIAVLILPVLVEIMRVQTRFLSRQLLSGLLITRRRVLIEETIELLVLVHHQDMDQRRLLLHLPSQPLTLRAFIPAALRKYRLQLQMLDLLNPVAHIHHPLVLEWQDRIAMALQCTINSHRLQHEIHHQVQPIQAIGEIHGTSPISIVISNKPIVLSQLPVAEVDLDMDLKVDMVALNNHPVR